MSPHTVTGHFWSRISGDMFNVLPREATNHWLDIGLFLQNLTRLDLDQHSLFNSKAQARKLPRQGTDTYSVAKPLDVLLCQLFAVHQALNPSVKSGNRQGLQCRGGELVW